MEDDRAGIPQEIDFESDDFESTIQKHTFQHDDQMSEDYTQGSKAAKSF